MFPSIYSPYLLQCQRSWHHQWWNQPKLICLPYKHHCSMRINWKCWNGCRICCCCCVWYSGCCYSHISSRGTHCHKESLVTRSPSYSEPYSHQTRTPNCDVVIMSRHRWWTGSTLPSSAVYFLQPVTKRYHYWFVALCTGDESSPWRNLAVQMTVRPLLSTT